MFVLREAIRTKHRNIHTQVIELRSVTLGCLMNLMPINRVCTLYAGCVNGRIRLNKLAF